MYARKLMATTALCSLALLTATGCFFSDPLLTGAAKIVGGHMTSLSVAEVQAVYNFVTTQLGADNAPPFSDAQAQALIQFLRDNDIDTLERVRYLIQHPDEIYVSDEVRELLDEQELRGILEGLSGVDFHALL